MRKYVSVTAEFDADGNLLPLRINWEDGRHFKIDRVTDIRYINALDGATDIRYTCRISGKDKHLFLSRQRWFLMIDD